MSFLCCCLIFCSIGFAQSNKEKVELKGSWNYSLPNAPYQYQNGTIHFKNTDGHLSADINVGNSSSVINVNEIKKDKGGYTCSFKVDEYNIEAIFKPQTDRVACVVTVDNQEIYITLTPLK